MGAAGDPDGVAAGTYVQLQVCEGSPMSLRVAGQGP